MRAGVGCVFDHGHRRIFVAQDHFFDFGGLIGGESRDGQARQTDGGGSTGNKFAAVDHICSPQFLERVNTLAPNRSSASRREVSCTELARLLACF